MVNSGLVVMDNRGELHRFPSAKSHKTVSVGTHLQTSVHTQDLGLGDALAVFSDAVWIKHASLVPEDQPNDQ